MRHRERATVFFAEGDYSGDGGHGTDDATACPHWFALQVRSRSEKAVRDALQALQVQQFLPLYSEISRWSDRSKVIERPLFPGYVFARFDPRRSEIFHLFGVIHVLATNLHPTPIAAHEIENLERVLAARRPVEPCLFAPGQAVTIEHGPLAGTSGVVIRSKGHARLVVSIELLRRSVSVEVDSADLADAQP